jgi:hypothetical protein
LVHTTAPGSRDARSTYTRARLRRDTATGTGLVPVPVPLPVPVPGPVACAGAGTAHCRSRYVTRPRYSTGLTPYTRLNAVDRAKALP